MSSAPAQLAVVPTASTVVTSTPQMQKDFLDETLARQNSVGNRVRGSLKGKHLTRSHAMREATSPPRTPTPRSENLDTSPVSFSSTETINDSKLRVQSSPLSTSPSLESQCVISNNCSQHPLQNSTNAMYSPNDNTTCGVVCNQSQLDVDFPKLSPPKSSKCSRNSMSSRDSGEKLSNIFDSNKIINSSDLSSQPVNNFNGKKNCDLIKVNGQINNGAPQSGGMQLTSQSQGRMHHQQVPEEPNDDIMENSAANSCGAQTVPCPQNLSFDKENRCLRNDAQNSINASTYSQDDCRSSMNESPHDNSVKGERLAKKHRSGATSKGSKPRLKNMGSSSSMDGGNSTSGFISRGNQSTVVNHCNILGDNADSSTEQFTDQSGVDLLSFFKETLNKNLKDRTTLLNIEKELVDLANDKTQHEITFPSMSSYNRMLIHRVAAFFGMDHNVDNATQQCVIVAKTKSTRIPDIRFASLLRERMSDEPRKSILKRDSHSFEDPRQGFLMVDRGVLDRKAKSFEEREEEYEKVRRRIFKGRDGGEITGEEAYWHWSSTESSEQTSRMRQNKLLKVQSMSTDSRSDGRPSVSKSHSFGGYGGPPPCGGPLTRGDSVNSTKSAGGRLFTKQDSIGSSNTPWRLSPSSSGSIYHFDPSNLPPSQAVAPAIYNNKSIGSTMIRNNRTEKRSKPEQVCTGQNTSSSVTDGSEETLSESSSQTVLNARESEDNPTKVTKENHINREMSDIQEESANNSIDDANKTLINSEEIKEAAEQKPKLKNQATSPNIPSPVPSDSTEEHNETPTNDDTNLTDSCEIQTNLNQLPHSESTSPTNMQTENKKDESKSASSNIPLMNYATNYTPTESNTVFPSPGNNPYPPAAYQQAPDGSVYAVPQPMVYAYPPPMDGEIQGYFMPIYEQAGQRDPNGLVPAATQAIYQPTGGTTAVVPVAYPTAPFGGAPLYQGQVVYSPEQYAPSATTTGQMQQYQMTYPVGYPYPYNGYWGQAMTYYVPPQAIGNTVPSSILPPPLPPGAQSNPGNNTGNSGKRNSPPHQNMSSSHNSQSTTPANTYQFAQSVPFTLTSDPSGPTMYAIPQATVFPNMLPYGPPATPSASAGVITTIPPHQPNAVISPLISHPSGPTGPHLPIDPSVTGYAVANANGNHTNNNGTPHSAPSTPLSNPLPLPHQHRNPPLFATPPIMPNGYNTPMHNQNFCDHSNMNNHIISNYDKKNLNTGGGKKINGNSYIPNGRQTNYNHQQSQRKPNIGDIPNMSTNQNNTNRQMHMTQQQQQQKRITNDKIQTGGILVGNPNLSCNSVTQNSDKPRTGIRSKPGNLDLRRSASQRNSPSTNSIESNNNSPNSIVSNHLSGGYSADHSQSMYMTRGTHIPPMHPPTAAAVVAAAAAAAAANDAAAACHQPLIGTYNHPAPAAGMYIKYGQAYFAHPTMALPNNRRSPPSEIRPSLTPLTGVYPTVNMMLPAPRQMQPRHPNPNYKGNKPSR